MIVTMMIVRSLVEHVEWLFERARLPSVDALRPTSCPLCGELAFSPGERLGIVGHGTYCRQVLGVVEVAGEAVTHVRRYLCRGCGHTISVLSDELHPRRWYAAGVIFEALELHLIQGVSEGEIRRRFGIVTDSESWRSLCRWRRALLATLWYWLARRLGVRGEATTREEGCRRLKRILLEASVDDPLDAARHLLCSTAHSGGFSWPLGHDPPEELVAKRPL